MNKLLLILILIFSLQSWAKADDISEFEIEGMSIGDSLLDYYSKDEIKNKKFYRKQAGENKKYAIFNLNDSKSYEKVNVFRDDPLAIALQRYFLLFFEACSGSYQGMRLAHQLYFWEQ